MPSLRGEYLKILCLLFLIPLHSLEAACSGKGFVSGEGSYAEGLFASLRAVPDEDAVCTCWKDPSGNVLSEEPVFSIQMLDDVKVEAHFEDASKQPSSEENTKIPETTPEKTPEATSKVPVIAIVLGLVAVVAVVILIAQKKRSKKK